LFEKAADAIFLLEAEGAAPGKIVAANQAAAEMHGYSIDELLDLNIKDLDTTKKAKEVSNWIKRMLEGEWIKEEINHRRKDGSIFPVEVSAGLLELGKQKYILAFDRNVTRRKQAIEEKERLILQLQRAEKMEAIGTLAGGVAHDLNNILGGIVSYPELILMDLPQDSHLKNPILTIQQSGYKAAAIVQDLLTLARRGIVANEVVNLNEIVKDYLKSAEFKKLESFHSNILIKTDIKPDLLNIIGSPVHLSKTLMNIVSNAVEAIDENGTVTISVNNQYLDRPVKGYDTIEQGDYVVLEVTDNGTGIPLEHINKIFEPFYSKKKMGRSGTGLGMAVVWGTVKDHKGYINVQSTEEIGTTFTLYFPVTRKEMDKEEPLLSIKDYMGNGESILVVDDVEEQREIAFTILTKLGYFVNTVSSGEEAVIFMKNNSVELLVLDMIMDPGINGLETYKRIIELHPRQKAIIASGFSETDHVKKAQKLGAGQYIKKPYTLEKIGLAVKEELKK
ncbi:MAG: PAS domain S-box protein, partial [Proteobacteria bacterium]|nr:PAS domain S-box protein [Pseudomonadota bacterium]